MKTDTIAAIATAMAGSGIGIVRISGEEAVSITDQIFHMPGGKKLSDMETHTIHYGHIRDGEEVIDEVMVLLMRGPRSYTDEAHFGDSYQIWSTSCRAGRIHKACIFERTY